MSDIDKISLRASQKEDANFVNDLTRAVMTAYVEKTWSTEEENAAYFQKNSFDLAHTKIIQVNGVDAGRISVIKTATEIYLDNIHLLPQYQSQGIGSKVIQLIFQEAKECNLPVKLQLLRSNPVKALYERLGFQVVDENKTHFFMEYPDSLS